MDQETVQELSKKDVVPLLETLAEKLVDLYNFRDFFFENHPVEMAKEKNKLTEDKMDVLAEQFDSIDEKDVPVAERAQYLYMKGRVYNVSNKYDPRATQCLSKAVKLNPRLVNAWNELGLSFWKNKNIREAKTCFEGALKQERNRVALRCLSIILRQETTQGTIKMAERTELVERSHDLAKEAVEQDPKDGLSWSILGNAHLSRYFLVAQDPATLKAAMSAYKLASSDPAARGQPDLYHNYGMALKYNEQYKEALEHFEQACRLDPSWELPVVERNCLKGYLHKVGTLLRTRGKIKTKKVQQMVQSIEPKMAGKYTETMKLKPLSEIEDGDNKNAFVLGRVVGSVFAESSVPFAFGLVDASLCCVSVTVYNWADGRGVIIGDSVAIPQPVVSSHCLTVDDQKFEFKSIRINNPTVLLVNGKRIGLNQVAGTQLRSSFEMQ